MCVCLRFFGCNVVVVDGFFYSHFHSSILLRYFGGGAQRMARIFKVVATMKCVDKRICMFAAMSGEEHFTISQSVYKNYTAYTTV